MNNIDNRLHRQGKNGPRRKLSVDFTDRVMARAQAERHKSTLSRAASTVTRSISMKLRGIKHVGALAAFAIIILGGTTYATIRWQGSEGAADYGGITTLANGDTQLWVEAHNCGEEQGKQYFHIKAGSKITPEQLTDMVAGTCENLDTGSIFPGIPLSGTLPHGLSFDQPDGYAKILASTEVNTQYYLAGGIIKHVDLQNRTITYATLGEADRVVPLNKDVKIFKSGEPQSLESIKNDQTGLLVLQGQGTYAQAQGHFLESGRTSVFLPGSTVYGIELTHHQPYNFLLEGKEFTRLVPKSNDKNAPTGKENPEVIKYYQDPKHLVEEHPLHEAK